MNYRHSYHAGNSADVFKHYVLGLVLEALRKKPAPFCVIDSHAGGAVYPLQRPGEFEQGIGMLWPQRKQWPTLAGYLSVVAKYNTDARLSSYPGSPYFIQEGLRAHDRAVFIERQGQPYKSLKAAFSHDNNSAVHHADAWQAIKGFLPPRERRGVLFIDPPYEDPDEFQRVVAALKHSIKHWRNGIYMVWYPIKARAALQGFYKALRELSLPACAVEFTTLPTDVDNRLNGSGLLLINSPWGVVDILKGTLAPLAHYLAGPAGRGEVKFLELEPHPHALLDEEIG